MEEALPAHLIAFLGTYPHWQNLPTVGRTASGDILVFYDARQPLAERKEHIDGLVAAHDVTSVCRVVTASGGCDDGVHEWHRGETATYCARCEQMLYPAPTHWRLAALDSATLAS